MDKVFILYVISTLSGQIDAHTYATVEECTDASARIERAFSTLVKTTCIPKTPIVFHLSKRS